MEATLIEKMQSAGIIVALPGDLPLATIIPIVDSLLASPILAVDVAFGGDELPQLLHDLRERVENKLLIGVSGVETAVHFQTLPLHYLDYISSPRLEDDLLDMCQTAGVAYLPGVITVWAAQAAQKKGCGAVRLRTGGPAGPDYVRAIRAVQPDLVLIVETELAAVDVARYQQAGADALLIATPLFTGPTQTMADLIIQARAFNRAWQQNEEFTAENGKNAKKNAAFSA